MCTKFGKKRIIGKGKRKKEESASAAAEEWAKIRGIVVKKTNSHTEGVSPG